MSIIPLYPSGQSPMPQSWQDRLASAFHEAQVVDVARDFLAQFSPEEIASLPEACRPGKLVDGDDVTEYALLLVQHRCQEGEGPTYAIYRLTNFFSNATLRLSQVLHAKSQTIGDAERESA